MVALEKLETAAGSGLEARQTPAGRQVLLYYPPKTQSPEMAKQVLRSLCPGGELFGRPIIFIANVGAIDSELRTQIKNLASEISKNVAPIAVVCANPIFRLAMKALCIVTPHSGPLKVVEDEATALSWMDTVARGQ